MKITSTENRVQQGKNNFLKITVRGHFVAEYKFDFNLLKCFVCFGVDLFPSHIKDYPHLSIMAMDITELRDAIATA